MSPQTVYDATNVCGGTLVFDVDTKAKLGQVIRIDIALGEVEMAHFPVRVSRGEVETFKFKYRSIYPIFGGDYLPGLFHCYGRLA